MTASKPDLRWLAAAAALSERARPISDPNPAVGAIIVKNERVVGRGWTRADGRPHAEAMALSQASSAAKGATLYTTLEPCAHASERGPTCANLTIEASIARVVIGTGDPDPRTAGAGIAKLQAAGVETVLADCEVCRESLSGYLIRAASGRPHVTLKLALSIDGRIALADGSSRWITGPQARAHTHRERARADAILVGGGTLRSDDPALDVRLEGLEERTPARWILTRGKAPNGWNALPSPKDLAPLAPSQYLFVEGGAGAAAAFLRADHVDRLLIYRAPIIIGDGRPGIGDIGLTDLATAHGRWRRSDTRRLGSDTLEVYQRVRPETPARQES